MKRITGAVACCLLLAFVLTGCDSFKEARERSRKERQEIEQYAFDNEKDFLNHYRKEITNALRTQDEDALRSMFCDYVLENTADLDEGIDYILGMEDWSNVGELRSNCSAYKEYNHGEHFTYVNAWEEIEANGTKYKIFFNGFASYYAGESIQRFVKENTGLTNLIIFEADKEQPSHLINGIYYPGRDEFEEIAKVVLSIDWPSDEEPEDILTPELMKSADEDELEAFIDFLQADSYSKKKGIFFFLDEKKGDYILTTDIRFELEDRSVAVLVKDGLIDGAVFNEDNEHDTPRSGEVEGFTG